MAEAGDGALAFGMPAAVRGSTGEILITFLRLGTTSFGGPIAHLAYFRREFVERRRWLDEGRFAQLLALCQLLPGPASSQLGFAIGLARGGYAGALAAFVGFTAPSVLLLLLFAALTPRLGSPVAQASVHGLHLLAVSVVAQALTRMVPSLAPDLRRGAIAVLALVVALVVPSAGGQLLAIGAGAVVGARWCRNASIGDARPLDLPVGGRAALVAALLFGGLLLAALAGSTKSVGSLAALAGAFVRAGSLVFGGGHVVLPLLEASLVDPGWISADRFLAGYGAAQLVPGPLFAVSAYFGALSSPGAGALVAVLAMFTPGFLLLVAAAPAWSQWRRLPRAAPVLAGVNASVVGVLGAALIDPVVTSTIRSPLDAGIAGVGLLLLLRTRVGPLLVGAWCVFASILLVRPDRWPVG